MNNIVIHKIKSVAYNSYEFSQNQKNDAIFSRQMTTYTQA